MYQHFIGIDISKDNFAAAQQGKNEVKIFLNNPSGFEEFCTYYQQILAQSLVVLETTGGYELPLIRHLQKKQFAVHRANARKVKYFIRSYGRVAKTDAIDAIGLAQYAFERHSALDIYVENPQKMLVKLVQRRHDLKHMLVQEKNRRQAPDQQELKESFAIIITALELQIQKIESDIDQLLKANPHFNEQKKVLETVDGIGSITAIQLLALLPELGTLNRKKIASLAGLAPHAYESGKKVGHRSVKGGRPQVKSALFMAAMTAARSHSILGEFYQKLVKSGKKKMVALTALMRKILVIANARLRDFSHLNISSQHG
jgi:transposase